jgi:gliding motility-associated-like protein
MKIRALNFFYIILFLIGTAFNTNLKAQCSTTISHSLPDTIVMSATCTATLNWGTVTVTPGGTCTLVGSPTFVSATDGAINYNLNGAVPSGANILVTYSATINDGTSNIIKTLTFNMYVRDKTAPVLSGILANITVTSCVIPNVAPTITDNCTNPIAPFFSDAGPISTCGGGTITRTWTATDAAGNTGYFTQIITVNPDTAPPSFTTNATDLVIDCNPTTSPALVATWLANHGAATATDCNNITWSYTPNTPTPVSGCVGSAGSLTVVFTAKDACNNTSTTTAKIISTDVFPPVITQQAQNKIVDCAAVGTELSNWIDNNAGAVANDVCAGPTMAVKYFVNGNQATKTQLIAYFADSLKLACQSNVVIGTTTYNKIVGKMKVGFAFNDNCNNQTPPTEAIFAATDNIAPVFTTTASNKSVQCDTVNTMAAFTAWYNNQAGAIAQDQCNTTLTFRTVPTLSNAMDSLAVSQANSCGNTGKVTVGFFAKDACGNETAIPTTATFNIIDNIAPVFTTAPSSITVNCAGAGNGNIAALQAFVNTHGGGVATDNCGGTAPFWTFTWVDKLGNTGANSYPQIPTSGVGYPACDWFTDFIFKAKDECGNERTANVRFAVQDQTPPTFTNLQPDVTVDCNNIPAQYVDFPGASDNCGSANVDLLMTTSNINNNCSGTYQIKKTWSAIDQCGNKNTYTRTITVLDNQGPVIAGVPANITVACDAVPPIPNIVISDACDPKPDSVFVQTSTAGSNAKLCSFYNYVLTRKWTATDKCGNISTKSYTITVQDTKAPTFTVPANVTVSCFDAFNALVTGRPTLLKDDCDNAPKLDSSDVVTAGSCAGNNTYTRTWKASDACGNTITKVQTIVSKDTKKPNLIGVPADITLECGDPTPAIPSVTVKDSCDNSITPVYVSTNMPSSCIGNFKLKREWTATDNCGNISKKTQTITFLDTKKPSINVCPKDISVDNTPGLCEGSVPLEAPAVSDNCGTVISTYIQNESANITSSVPNDPDVIIEPIKFDIIVPLGATATASNVTFSIDLNNVDAEASTEYFDIIGENNTILGKTNSTIAQCGNSTTDITLTATQVNTWGQDGIISFILKPNIPTNLPPSEGINDICSKGKVFANLAFTLTSNPNLTLEYSIDNGTKILVNPIVSSIATMNVGKHLVKYFVKDCNNNVDSCQYNASVFDKDEPSISAPSDQNYVISGTTCSVKQEIPAPTFMFDNCGFGTGYTQKQPVIAGDSLLTFNNNSNLLAYFANDKIFTFTGVTSNAVTSNVLLTIDLKADAESAGEYFTFLGENNVPLGTTNIATCSAKGTTILTIPANDFNTWASDGQLVIKALSNKSFPISQAGTNPGINPCNNTVTANGQNDGSSYMTATLSFNTANPIFSTSGATVTAPKPLFQSGVIPEVTFLQGTTLVKYELSDAAGNKKTVTYNVVVEDKTNPIAKCKNAFVSVLPTSTGPGIINPADINDGSTDNCTIASISATPNAFACSDLGSTKNITLTVKDLAGNQATCSADVIISIEKPKPSYSLGICGNDTLKLFANPPAIPGAVYIFGWTGPNNFSSTLQNPYIPNVNAINGGTYNLNIYSQLSGSCYNGITTLEIPIDNQPNTPTITASSLKPCTNGELTLSTAAYTGKKVTYYWYKGIAPSGVLVDSTLVNSYTISNPTAGNAKYYVRVKVDICSSNPSASVSINAVNPPSATLTNAPIIEVCEGTDITLGTSSVGLGYKYQWSGPDNFSYTTQYPPVLTNAKPAKSGVYTLIVLSAEGCESTPALTTVNVKAKPKTPTLVANGLDCEGSSINLITNVTGVSTYHWVNPSFNEQVTTVNNLPLTNLNKATMKGNWKVYVMNNGCKSDESNAVDLKINSKPTITADYKNPACDGGTLELLGIGANNASYSWTGTNNFVSNVQNPSTKAIAGTYIAVVIDQNGCSNFDDVVVATKAKPEITAVTNNGAACVSGTNDIKVTATVFPFDSTYAYQWTGPNTVSNAKTLTLPNATAAVNGTYILQVTSKDGCKSTPFSHIVDVRNKPQTPVIKNSIAQNICEGDNILVELDNANTYIGAAVSYKWNTPAGGVTTFIPTLSITKASSINSGDYTLTVMVDGCESDISGKKKITVNKIPEKPVVTIGTPLCEGETLQLSTDFIANATYEWLGANNFTSSISNPTKPKVTEDDQGFYKVRVIVNGCPSPFSNSAFLDVNEIPKLTPIAKNSGAICLDSPNPNLTLSVESSTAVTGATYTWFNAKTNTQLNTASSSLNYNISNFTGYPEGLNEFYVITTFKGCSTNPSIPTSVNLNKIPVGQKAFAGADIAVCNEKSVSLAAQKPTIGTGSWLQVQGSSITIADTTLANTKVNGLVPGQNYILQWKLSNGACKDYSFDEVKINVNDTGIKAEAGDSIQLCSKTQTKLNANIISTGTTGLWTQLSTQVGVTIVNPTDPKTLVTGLSAGNMYSFKWTLSNASCKDYSTDDVFVFVEEPQGKAYAGVDFKACGDGNINLNASAVAGIVGKWTSLNGATVVLPNATTSVIKNLTQGQNLFVWSIGTKTCGTYSKDTVTVTYETAAKAVADAITVPYAGSITFNPTANDILPAGNAYTISIITQPRHGKVTITTDRKIEYQAENAFTGADDFEYKICNTTCPDVCTTAKVSVSVLGGDDCTVPTIITPNGDLINDRWEIPCLVGADYPNSTVVVFNQWGDEVFRSNSYKNDWEGTYNGQPLPSGTYFFVVNLGTSIKKNGFLIIER